MAQTFFDVLTGSIDTQSLTQTNLAVQSILDGQTVDGVHGQFNIRQDEDDDDVFQCGKCKRQFTSLSTFVSHKQARCQDQQHQSSQSPAPSTPAPQTQQVVLQGRMITDDISNSFDPMQTTILQVQGANIKSNPFLSQIGPLTKPSLEVPSLSQIQVLGSDQMNALSSIPGSEVELATVDHPAVFAQDPMGQSKTPKTKGKRPTILKQSSGTNNGSAKASSTVRQELTAKRTGQSVQEAAKSQPSLFKGEKTRLFCQYCNKVFTKNFDLSVHIRTHTGEKPYQCIVCGRAFAQKSNVKKHMASHKVWPKGRGETLPEYAFVTVVDTAPAEGTSAPEAPAQVEQASGAGQGSGGDAMETSAHDSSGENQVLGVMMDTSYRCEYCHERFENYNLLKKHMTRHKNEQVYRCVQGTCSASFKDLDPFLEHVRTHEHQLTYSCHMCSQDYPSLYDLGVHQYTHTSVMQAAEKAVDPVRSPTRNKIVSYNCTKCSAKYTSKEAMDHHLETSTHNYPCVFCKRVFVCERYLRRHVLIHNVKSLECRICQKRFNTAGYLRVHLATHSSERPFKCDQCDSAFNRKDKLRRHQRLHNPEKRYKCPFQKMTGCDKEFSRNDKLREHILTHGGHRPWACTVCGKLFARAAHAKQHQKTHSSKNSPNSNKKELRSSHKNTEQCETSSTDPSTIDARPTTSAECTTSTNTSMNSSGAELEESPMKMDEENPNFQTNLRPRRSVSKPKKFSDYSDPEAAARASVSSVQRLGRGRRVAKVSGQYSQPQQDEKVQAMLKEARHSGVTMSLQSLIEASRLHEQQLISTDTISSAQSSPSTLVNTTSTINCTSAPRATVLLNSAGTQQTSAPQQTMNENGLNQTQSTDSMTQFSVMTSNGLATLPIVFTQNGNEQTYATYQIADGSTFRLNLAQTLTECLAGQVVESKNSDGSVTLSVCYPQTAEGDPVLQGQENLVQASAEILKQAAENNQS